MSYIEKIKTIVATTNVKITVKPVGTTKNEHTQVGATHIIEALEAGKKVGQLWVKVEDEDLSAIFVKVHPQFRRKGIATKMYDAAEKKFSKPMVPSENLS